MINYDDLKDAYKVERLDPKLFTYLLRNADMAFEMGYPVFHKLNKQELISLYKEIVERDLRTLESL